MKLLAARSSEEKRKKKEWKEEEEERGRGENPAKKQGEKEVGRLVAIASSRSATSRDPRFIGAIV